MSHVRRKRPTNLSLSPAHLAFAHGYAQTHATSLSERVDGLLGALEHVVQAPPLGASTDLLDGILMGTPMAEVDKHALRQAHHENRVGLPPWIG